MAMTEPINSVRPHDQAEELLPWYATGQLDEPDRERVEAHLAECADCRAQVALERQLVREIRDFSPQVESGWARLRDRIAAPAPAPSPAPKRPTLSEQAADLWAAFTRPIVVAFATAQVAIITFASGLMMWLGQPAYHALGSAPAPASANVIVMFRSEATMNEAREALQSAGGSIVGGPTSAGAYLIHVEPRQRPAAVAKLQSNQDVQLAQPIDSSSTR
jgi:anti-sigma factor RsiW